MPPTPSVELTKNFIDDFEAFLIRPVGYSSRYNEAKKNSWTYCLRQTVV